MGDCLGRLHAAQPGVAADGSLRSPPLNSALCRPRAETMIQAEDLRPLRGLSSDIEEIDRLLDKFRVKREREGSISLTLEDLDEVLRWKLRGQYGRNAHHRQRLTDQAVRAVTKAAFGVRLTQKELELQIRVGVLTVLPGVGVPVASAVLALVDPETYGIIDFRVWRQMFPGTRVDYSVSGYLRYMRELWCLAAQLQWRAQEVDLAIWEYDLRQQRASG